MRLSRIERRADDMVSVRGVHFYPAQIEAVLASVEGMQPRFELALQREAGQDVLEIRVEVSERIFFDEMRRQRLLIDEAERRIQDEIRLPTRVKLVEPRSLGKAAGTVRLADERQR